MGSITSNGQFTAAYPGTGNIVASVDTISASASLTVRGAAARRAAVNMEGAAGAAKELASAFEGLKIAIAASGLLEFAANLKRQLAGTLRELAKLPQETLRFATIIGAG